MLTNGAERGRVWEAVPAFAGVSQESLLGGQQSRGLAETAGFLLDTLRRHRKPKKP